MSKKKFDFVEDFVRNHLNTSPYEGMTEEDLRSFIKNVLEDLREVDEDSNV